MKRIILFFTLLFLGSIHAQTECDSTDPGMTAGSTGCITFTYSGNTVQYTTVRAADGNIWLQQNLGSAAVATSAIDENAYGDLFQWGRWQDGHEKRTSATSDTAPEPNNPLGLANGNSNFLTSTPEWWAVHYPEDAWNAATPEAVSETKACDPCRAAMGNGWRVPTESEWATIIQSENLVDITSAFNSNLKLTVAGSRSGTSGNLSSVGQRGYYWSSTPSATNSDFVKYLYYSNLTMNSGAGGFRDQGSSVRCIKGITFTPPAPPQSLVIVVVGGGTPEINTNGGTLQLVSAVSPSTANQSVVYSITEGSEFATVSGNGLVTATANGTVTVQSVSSIDNAILNTISIVIINQVIMPQSIEITYEEDDAAIFYKGGTIQLSATILPEEASQDVIWSITEGSEFATIDANGLVTATDDGVVTVTVISTKDNTIIATIEVTVKNQNLASSAPYCAAAVQYDVEPITNVTFAGISNTTSADVNTTPAYEDFTAITGTVAHGQTYPLTVKGNTVGLFNHDIRVFIDWNNDDTFNMATEYYASSIENTSGTDAIQATLNITVPADAIIGTTRMRVTKDLWTAFEPGEFDACTNAYYGQVEDYTLNVTAPVAGVDDFNKNQFIVYPNPVEDILTIQSSSEIASVEVYNLAGQLIANSTNGKISLGKASQGLYIIKISFADGSTATQKVIKK